MKKYLFLALTLILCLVLCACGEQKQETVVETTPVPTSTPSPNPESLYFDIKYQYPQDGTVGFYLQDLDGDGIKEMFVGLLTGDIYERQIIAAMYTVTDGEAVKVLESTDNDKYYLTENGTVARETIRNAFQSKYCYYTYSNGTLSLMLTIGFDMEADRQNPWYEEEAGQKETLDEKTAMDFVQTYQSTYRNLEFT